MGLPRYLMSGRNIYIASSFDIVFYLVKMSEPKDSRLLSKEIGLYEAALGGNVAFWFESLNKNYMRLKIYIFINNIYLFRKLKCINSQLKK